MPVLYVTEQRSIIRKTSDRLVVEKDGTVLMEIPCLKLDTVLVYGNVQVTAQALAEMLDHGIELADFGETPEKGVVLSREALKTWFAQYEKELNSAVSVDGESLTWRQIFRRQAERLARTLLHDEPYQAFRWPC